MQRQGRAQTGGAGGTTHPAFGDKAHARPGACALHGDANSVPRCHRAKLVPTTFISAMPGSAAHSLRRAVAPSALRSPLGPHRTAPCTGQSCGAGWLRAAGPLGHLHTAGRGQAGSLGGN